LARFVYAGMTVSKLRNRLSSSSEAAIPLRREKNLCYGWKLDESIKRVLEPVERISEFPFCLTTVLTLTTTFDATGFDRGNVHKMLLAALGCNLEL
jgi:hypothetical protein